MDTAVLLGDTRFFHIGSYYNCEELASLIKAKHRDFIGIDCCNDFCFSSYEDFLSNYPKFKSIVLVVAKASTIYFNGEGMIEKNSEWGKSMFYLAKFIKNKYPDKRIVLLDFSCCIPDFEEWRNFNCIVPRDRATFALLDKKGLNLKLGFDCSVLRKITHLKYTFEASRFITVFRGRKSIVSKDIKLINSFYKDKEVYKSSAFWDFDDAEKYDTKDISVLDSILSASHLVVSSSFHGIIFALKHGIPFIPVQTIGTNKIETISSDILGQFYQNKTLKEWLVYYSNESNYLKVKNRIDTFLDESIDLAEKMIDIDF